VSLNGGASWSAGSGAGFSAPDGTYAAGAIAVRQRDGAGNLGAIRATTASFTIDTQAPVSPSFQLSVDSGSSGSDQISNNGAVTVSGLLSGHTWQYSSNGGASWSAAQAATTTSFKLAAGSYGPGAVAVRQLDLAGNASPASANSAPIRIDTTLPTVTSTLVGGTSLVVRFSEPVAFPGASTARFAVLNGTTSVAINGVSVDGAGTSVTLSLASAIASTSQVKVSYSDPTTANDATGALEDLAGNDLASRSATAVPIFLASTSVSMASGFHSGYKGVELTEAAGTASISGNASANDLTGNGFNNVLSGGGGADALTGSAGADEFLYASNSDSLLGTSTAPRYDRIRDLVIGTDTITMATAFAAPAGSISHRGTASALSEAAIATLLPTTTFAAGTAAAFSLGSGATSRSFLVLNDSVAGYQAATDGLIEITGFSGNLGGLAIL
jgi:Ca2+-binding RTX toxin-like protein